MCLKTVEAEDCDCYECVEERRGRQGGGCRESGEPDVLEMWRGAFQQAYREVQVDIFKAKIRSVMGKAMEKTAGLVLESMLSQVQEMKRRASDQELREKIEKLLKETAKA